MPLQLIYTSAPRGVVAGRSGYCTVARSATLREAVTLQLEKWSHYQHLSLSGGQERPIHCCRIIDVRGTRYHVLSRIEDAGLDFTGRTNFVAHHLVFTPEEVREFPSPAVILRDWTGWAKSWSQEPQILDTEDWSSLKALHQIGLLPAARWQRLTGDSANGYGLLDCRSGIVFCVDGVSGEEILGLIGESLELLELRDPSHDFPATRWQYTFTTSLQEQDTTADFRWRCFHSDNPASARFTGLDCRALVEIRPIRVTEVEASLARLGRQPPRFIEQPKKTQCFADEAARFKAVAEGVPPPTYQWFRVGRNNIGTEIPGAIESELLISPAPLGVTRYVVRITNSEGEETSEVAELSSERRPVAPTQPGHERPVQVGRDSHAPRGLAGDRGIEEPHRIQPSVPTRTADEIARNRSRIESQVQNRKYLTWSNFLKLIISVCIALMLNRWFENQRSSIKLTIAQAPENDFNKFTEVRKEEFSVEKALNGDFKYFTKVRKEGEEFKVEGQNNIKFVVDFKPERNRSDYSFQWYREATLLKETTDTLLITNVLKASSGNYRALIIKNSKTNVIIKNSKTNVTIELSKTNELKAKLTVQANVGQSDSKKDSKKNDTGLASVFGNKNSEEEDAAEIPGWKHISTGEANKGFKKFEPNLNKWLISDYKTSGIERSEWTYIYKIDPMTNFESKVFEMSFNFKDLNESEVGLMFRKGDQFYFHGLVGTNFVSFQLEGTNRVDLDDKKSKPGVRIKPGFTNLTLNFTVKLDKLVKNSKTNTALDIRCWSPEALIGKSCIAPPDYGDHNWQIGYAFARGKSSKESKTLTISINPD
jgi:hypothetical protein